jgi:hypothetical protein
MAYIVKIITPARKCIPPEVGYLSGDGHFTKQLENATRFIRREAAEIHAGAYNAGYGRKVAVVFDEKNIIGTYFSTYDKKPKVKGMLVNILCIILLPILLPIAGIIMIKEYTMKLIGKEYR